MPCAVNAQSGQQACLHGLSSICCFSVHFFDLAARSPTELCGILIRDVKGDEWSSSGGFAHLVSLLLAEFPLMDSGWEWQWVGNFREDGRQTAPVHVLQLG